ncbi:hypothetical protein NC652_012371 [Populus alba x Populus x berolinensis]|nr:hypothetical protein NC652_012371 [Populus alba x Populus x berolinensis]
MDVDFQSWLLRSSFSLRICATSIVGASKGRSYLSQIHHVINNFCAIVVCSGKFWSILWAKRVKITLAEKGIKYESMKQNLIDKSPLLLEMNPVLKRMIRVLIHNRVLVCESLNIVQYIDGQFDLKLTGVYKPKKLSCLKCELMTLLYCRTADYQALFRFDDHRSKQALKDDAVEGLSAQRIGEPNTESNDILFM